MFCDTSVSTFLNPKCERKRNYICGIKFCCLEVVTLQSDVLCWQTHTYGCDLLAFSASSCYITIAECYPGIVSLRVYICMYTMYISACYHGRVYLNAMRIYAAYLHSLFTLLWYYRIISSSCVQWNSNYCSLRNIVDSALLILPYRLKNHIA